MGYVHPYIPNSPENIVRKMLDEIGAKSVEEFYKEVPEKVRLKEPLRIPEGMSEMEVKRRVEAILSKNLSTRDLISFLGGGVWPHYVPALVDEVIRRGELLTSYTPYQAEVSQGILQALFEYQSMICALTGMEFANSSLYDWSSALGEAARMAMRFTGRDAILVPHYISPERLQVLRNYVEPIGGKIIEYAQDRLTGQVSLEDLSSKANGDIACAYLEMPSYLGHLEKGPEAIADIVHKRGGLFVVGVDPVSLGILKPPRDYGADIVVGEGQPFGCHMNYGGPLLGLIACSDLRLLRQMPGRVVGLTTTRDGTQRAFALVMQTREQHIRRERATSNITTNAALMALAAAVYLSLLGPKGLRELCMAILAKSHYAAKELGKLPGLKVPQLEAPFFKEFVVGFSGAPLRAGEVNARLLKFGIHGGKVLTHEFPELGDSALYCVTEVHSKEDIDRLAQVLKQILAP